MKASLGSDLVFGFQPNYKPPHGRHNRTSKGVRSLFAEIGNFEIVDLELTDASQKQSQVPATLATK